MKRSEMVSLITKEVNDRLADMYSYWDLSTASEFLAILEKAGMLPPKKQWRFMSEDMTINEWESEDGR